MSWRDKLLTCHLNPLCEANCVKAFWSKHGQSLYRFPSSYLHLYGLSVDTCTSTLFDKLHASVTHLPCPASTNEYACCGGRGFPTKLHTAEIQQLFFFSFFFFTFYFLCVFCRLCLKKEAPRSANYHFNCLFIYYSQA